MEQFSLDKWLQDKSRKLVTRDGRPVRILCTDAKTKDGCCIIAAIETDGEEEGYQFFKDGTTYSSKSSIEDCADLFFADEEKSMNEFEARIYNLINFSDPYNYPSIKEVKEEAKILLDLARKELGLVDNTCGEYALNEAYKQGKQDVLKDLPKWKKATEDKKFDEFVLLFKDEKWAVLTTVIHKGDHYIKLSDLETLPKEK